MAKDRARDPHRVFKKMGEALGYYTADIPASSGEGSVRMTSKPGDYRVMAPGKGHVRVGETLPFTGAFSPTEYSPTEHGTRGIRSK